jgi:hypothetical protein
VVVAEKGATVLALSRDEFDAVLGPLAGLIARQKKLRMLKSVPLLAPLSERELVALADVRPAPHRTPVSQLFSKGFRRVPTIR